jgi:uncharacterized protein
VQSEAILSDTFRPFLGALLAAALVFAATVRADVLVPPLKARVTDLTGTLSASQRAGLEESLRAFEALKGSQIAILIVPTTEPETIEQYAIRVAEQWKLGRKGVDDGALLLVAKNDRALRIEVGYGLEGVLPDAITKRVIEEIIVPRFREGDFHGGLQAGTQRLIRLIEGEPLPPPKQDWRSADDNQVSQGLLAFALASVFALPALFGPLIAAVLASGMVGFLLWLALGSVWLAILGAIGAFVLTLFVGVGGGPRGWYRGGPGGGGGFGGGGFGGGGGGGGFGGGGGGFGGGGASGKW